MHATTDEFASRITTVMARFFRQNAQPCPSDEELAGIATRLSALVTERGLPPPLPPGELGKPGGMSEAECAPLVARVFGGASHPLLAEAVRQLVKACFYPEFKVCRDSFREVAADGACRRQQLARVRGRTSGAHCVDCPHWVALAPQAHAELLAQEWRGDVADFNAHREAFLPEDFRALRQWLHAAARR